jgi:L-ascorbate metabolism protein UlaG (beta-lactamase superfamily)
LKAIFPEARLVSGSVFRLLYCGTGLAVHWKEVMTCMRPLGAGTLLASLLLGTAGCAQPLPREALAGKLQLPLTAAPSEAFTATYFGTTTLMFKAGDDAVMTDGFFSRPGGLLKLAMGTVEPDETAISAALWEGNVPRKMAAVLVSHSHHDHALDSALVACATQATVIGSESVRKIQLGQLQRKPDCIGKFQPITDQVLDVPGFEVQALASKHSPNPLFKGAVNEILVPPAHVSHYRLGETYSFLIRRAGAAAFVAAGPPLQEDGFSGVRADVVFLSIGGLRGGHTELIREYWQKAVSGTGAKVVVPIHWDDFTKPLSTPLPVMPLLFGDFTAVMQVLQELADQGCPADCVSLGLLQPFKRYEVKNVAQ